MIASPITRLSVGLVGLVVCGFILADLAFGLFNDPDEQTRVHRVAVATHAARQVAERVGEQDYRAMERALESWRRDDPSIASVTVHDAAGGLVAASGAPAASAPAIRPMDRIVVPIQSAQGRWGEVEFAFSPLVPATTLGWLADRRLYLAVGLPLALLSLVYVYLRRALQYLDPTTVVPDRLRTAFDGLSEGVVLLDAGGRVVLANQAMRATTGAAEKGLHGKRFESAFPIVILSGEKQPPWRTVISTGQMQLGAQVHIGLGANRRIGHMNCSPITDGGGKVRGCLVTFADMTAIEQRNAELRTALDELQRSREHIEEQNRTLVKLANHDGLTDLLNRRCFFEMAEAASARCNTGRRALTVFMLDVDHFKSFNDKYGHSTGDAVLKHVAKSFRDTLRAQDTAARYGGEEFCGLIEDLSAEAAVALAERVRKNIEADAGRGAHEGQDLTVTVSVGVACAAQGEIPLQTLIKQADESLYVAKRSGRNRVVLASAAREEDTLAGALG